MTPLTFETTRSTVMYLIHEALAREQIRERHRWARTAHLAHEARAYRHLAVSTGGQHRAERVRLAVRRRAVQVRAVARASTGR